MKKISIALCAASLLIWWQIPAAAAIMSAVNGILICRNYDRGRLYKVSAVLCAVGLCLAIWNWDLHIGMQIVEWYHG